jgi:hypothetical protein
VPLFFLIALAGIFIWSVLLTLNEIRKAPEGFEHESGFQIIREARSTTVTTSRPVIGHSPARA